MSYGNNSEGIMIKSEILGLKDMNPAIQGMILKLSTGQYLMKSNFTVSQVKWKERSKELNETTLHMMIDNIINHNKTVEDKYARRYSLHILNDNMKFSKSHVDKLVSSDLLPALMSEGMITIKALDDEMQKKTIDTLIKDASTEYKGQDRYGRSGLSCHDAIVPGLTMELYEYMLDQAEAAKKKFRDKKKADEFHDGVIDGDIKGEILEHSDISFDILEKHGKPLMSELLLRLRTNQELSLEKLPVGSYKEDYDSAEDKVTNYLTDIMEYNTCPLDYIAKIVAVNKGNSDSNSKVQKQLLELEREDVVLLQLQLMLEEPQKFQRFYSESYHGRQVFWTRFVQLLDGKPEFMAAMKSMMLDAGTLDLPKPKGDFND